jgi:chromatin remodeling complex protein RSC6
MSRQNKNSSESAATETNDSAQNEVEQTVPEKSPYQVFVEEKLKNNKDIVALQRRNKQVDKELFSLYKKDIRAAKKNKHNRKSNRANKEPSGFNKPAPVPDKLCDFLDLEYGTELPRTQVTKRLYDIIRARNLQDPDDKRIIHPDADFTELFNLQEGDDVRFQNFQTHMKKLYPVKSTATATAAAPAVVEAAAEDTGSEEEEEAAPAPKSRSRRSSTSRSASGSSSSKPKPAAGNRRRARGSSSRA